MIRLELEAMLQARGRSYYSLARDAKINSSIISRMKQHKIKGVTFEVLDRICVVLECEPCELIVRVPDKKTKAKK
jgi:putative transcriptional regulator